MKIAAFSSGTNLKRDLTGLPGVAFSHVGIYVGDAEVIHFNGEWGSGSEARVEKASLAAFTGGKPVRAHAVPDNPAHGKAIVAEARRILSEPHEWNGGYDFVFKNCEDFTVHCFRVQYRRPGDGRTTKGKPAWSQRAKAIAGGALAFVGTALGLIARRKFKNGRPPHA